MTKLLGTFLGVLLLGVGVSGCGGTCSTYCDYWVQCGPDIAEDAASAAGYAVSCDWDGSEDTLDDDCMDACERAYDWLSDSEMEQVDLCVECADEDLAGSCNGGDYVDAIYDRCDSECDDTDVGDWSTDISDDWQSEAIECLFG